MHLLLKVTVYVCYKKSIVNIMRT